MPGLDLPPAVEEYRLIRLLGSGAMGSVYLAQDRLLERLVAIKFIAAGAPSASARHRFFAEARAAARITHPNVVAVYRVAEFKRQPFLVAEYVRGRSLAELACPLGSDQLIKIASDLSRGLAAAHRRGVLHRDLKPANAMISEDGVTKLLDFGLAELVSDAGIAEHARLAGTPLYMAPELWTGGDPSPRSDIFALGILLFELYSGAHPFDRRDGNKPADRGPPLDTLVAEPNRALCAIIERCIASDPLLRWSSDALVDALDGVAMIGSAEPRKHEGTPYRGLLAFEAEHRDLFFGRRSEALAIRERLRSERLIVVAGDSGTGKSSLCRAGVLPLLESDTRVVTVVLGRAPMTSLAVALAPIAGESESVTLERLAGDPTGLARSLRATGREIVLFIDQLEELVTLAPPDDARLVAETLQALVLSHGTRVLATARSDFLTRLAAFRGLGDDLAMSLSLLRPLSAERLFEVVVEPAAAMGFVFESGEMVEQLITEARVAEGGLPLLQFALGELWDARDLARKLIPATALTAIGGVAGALARHADGVIAAQPASDRAAARAIFLSLVTTEGTRAHRDHDELIELAARRTPRARAVLDALVSGRLLVAQEAESGGKTAYAIAHEALLSSWGTLRSWLGEDVEGRAAKQRIEHAAAEWERLGRRADALWNARQLSDAAKVDAAALTSREVEFVAAARRRVRGRRVARWLAILAVPAVVGAAAFGIHLQRVAKRNEEVGHARRITESARASKARYLGLRDRAFDRFDRGAADAEPAWTAALAAATPVDNAYADAEQRLERVLQEHPDDGAARELLAAVLLDRAELADLSHRTAQRDDLVRRAALYDPGEGQEERAELALTVRAPNPSVVVRRYSPSGGKLVLSEPGPWNGATLPAGSVVLEISAPGRERVRVPLLVKRGENLQLAVDLPRASPPGFVYVPAGRFLYGSGGEEDLRPMYITEPMHAIAMPSYWIARTETTYGEWIEYLRSLPSSERASRTPNTIRQGFVVKLAETRGVYSLTIGDESHLYTVREGELLHYVGRTAHADHNWSKLPVTGVSYLDAVAYTDWLRTAKGIPGAHPCTEWEWEHAARGADGRIYPNGDHMEPDDANFDLTYGRVLTAFGPDEVGTHRESDSVYGVHDMAGNVWEVTSSHSDPKQPVVRGGCFFQVDIVARAMNRQPDLADRRDAYYGIRVCATYREEGTDNGNEGM